MFETVSLLKNTLLTTPQHEATKVKYPCVGFTYMAIQNKNKIIDLYKLGTDKNYNDYIKNLICRAGRRKESKSIDESGEYIIENTIVRDFSDIVNRLCYKEMNIVDEISHEYTANELYILLDSMQNNNHIIVNRSHETFVMFKITHDKYLVVDSHKNKHGEVDTLDAIKYITKYGHYKGLISLGIEMDNV